ncbi:Fic family protein [Actinomyces sp. B33]|uniref:Fic family protein n=1 Tax=Actinomyces sp. B33 TaxID=2942131 RepID=UPI0023425189|nr:Fic/DOC family N-terminal domain-containing protein [Actinomyces sp. B33]MDC4233472.1 Fic family protein [Actinomyces sp. B33]
MWNTPDEPYQDLPPLPPAAQIETPAVLKGVISASRALARLDGACKRLPDPTMLINLIPLLEAQASSEIENIVTTNDELFKAAHGALSAMTPQVKEALRYREALWAGFESVRERPITTATAIAVCEGINGHQVQIRNRPGTYIGNPRTGRRIYTPPEGQETIQRHLSAWESFLHGDHGIDPLVVMALAHYQFEAIHPFFDGNGRTGRILNLLVLIESGVLELPILYLSGHITRHKDEYYRLLKGVTRNDEWTPWILFLLSGITETATWTLDLVERTDELREQMSEEIRRINSRVPAADITRLLFTQPYLRIDAVVEAGLAKRQTASRWLTEIAEHGTIGKERIGRTVLFVNDRLLDMLFAAALPE